MTTPERAIHDLLDEITRAHADRDAGAIAAVYTDSAVNYTLAPPLQQIGSDVAGPGLGVDAWLDTFEGGVGIHFHDPAVTADGAVAFVTSLTRMTATPAGAPGPFSFWYRTTFGLRLIDGRWRIAHAHESVPFHMDGSFRVATDLQPADS